MSPTPEVQEVAEYAREDLAARDGIAEDDNPIPLWFNIGFYGFIVVGIVYILYYTLSGWSAAGEYEVEVAAAETKAAAVRAAMPTTNPYRGNEAAIAEGQQTFATICSACHKVDGTGLVGPSLIDPYWKYGQTDAVLFESVSTGRPEGMPGWGAQLGSEKIWKALAYLETLPTASEPGVGAPDYVPPTATP